MANKLSHGLYKKNLRLITESDMDELWVFGGSVLHYFTISREKSLKVKIMKKWSVYPPINKHVIAVNKMKDNILDSYNLSNSITNYKTKSSISAVSNGA